MNVVIRVGTGRYSSQVTANSGAILAAFRTLGVPRQFDRQSKSHTIPTSKVDDVAAYCEFILGARVQIIHPELMVGDEQAAGQ